VELYIGNLTKQTTENDLQAFFKSFAKQTKFEMLHLVTKGSVIYFAKADTETDKIGIKAIKKLNLSKMNGRVTVVREYQHRHGNNERRALNWRNSPAPDTERRLLERRLRRKLVTEQEPSYFGYDKLAHKG